MKKLFCLFTAIITIMSFAACGNDDIESGSKGQEISKTEISRQNEQPSEDESSFAEVSEPVSEEISEPVSEEASEQPPEVSEPQQSIDDEPPTEYRLIEAHNARQMAEKLKELALSIDDPSTVMTIAERELYAPLSAILAEGYIINPIIGDTLIESAPENPYGALEMIFFKNHKVSLTYYCRNSDKVSANVQITYPNEEMLGMIRKHGIDGYRMFYAGNEKTADKLTAEEVEKTGFSSISVCEISCGGKKYEAIKYVKKIKGDYNRVVFMHDGKVFVITYLYIDDDFAATHDIDDILDTIKLEKLYFDGQSGDDSPTTPDCTYGQAEDYPIFGAYDASGLVDKLIEINEQLKNGTAPLYDPSYYVCMEQILSDGYVFNPTLNGEYAKNAFDYPPVEVDFIPILTAVSYDFSTKECMFRINAMYPKGKNATNISKYGIEGFAMSRFGCPDTPLDKMPEDKINYVCASAEIKTINVGGSEYTALICTNMWGIGRDTVAFLYEGKIIEIEFEPRNGCRETFESLLGKVGLEKYGFASDR